MSALLPQRLVEKPWGRDVLPEPFTAPEGKRIGEIWFESPPMVDRLLVKYLFTSDKLSVQVHPDDAQAEKLTGKRLGKEECWLILDCEPGARIGIGFDNETSSDELRAAAIDGSIEERMRWFDVSTGDFFYIPANTVHAIGAGCSLIEIQQNSDITYRLYDYGRPRDLHLDEAVAVASGERHPAQLRFAAPDRGEVQLVEGPHFRVDRLDGSPSTETASRYSGPALVMPLSGEVAISGEAIQPGQCGCAGDLSDVELGEGAQLLLAQPIP